jgi:hypothetical protein
MTLCAACAQAKDFIRRLLVVDEAARMTMAEALQHPWLADVATPCDTGPPRVSACRVGVVWI